jgi:hypothetical protein
LAQWVAEIRVRVRVGTSLMAASDDPFFLGIRGGSGREFRLNFTRGRSLRRGHEDLYVLAGPGSPATNVDHPELNDPTTPEMFIDSITGVYLRKGSEPIPNVRAMGEMDDRLEIIEAQVEIDAVDQSRALYFERSGPIWLGLVSGVVFELQAVDRQP